MYAKNTTVSEMSAHNILAADSKHTYKIKYESRWNI